MHLQVDAGANFIITQFFFESKDFIDFVRDCRRVNIQVPIIPGCYLITTYDSLIKLSQVCKVEIPEYVLEELRPIKGSDEKVTEYGIQLLKKIIGEIHESKASNGYHLFTLNRCDFFFRDNNYYSVL